MDKKAHMGVYIKIGKDIEKKWCLYSKQSNFQTKH